METAAARDRDLARSGPLLFDFPQPQLGPGMRPILSRPAGTISLQPELAGGRLLDDAIGYRFAVLGPAKVLAGIGESHRRRLGDWGAVLVPATD